MKPEMKESDYGKMYCKRLYNFALSIIGSVWALLKNMVTLEIGKQLLRSGSSIAANYGQARCAFSKGDFADKINIFFKGTLGINLWLRLLKDSGINNDDNTPTDLQVSAKIRNLRGKSVSTFKRATTNLLLLTSHFLFFTFHFSFIYFSFFPFTFS